MTLIGIIAICAIIVIDCERAPSSQLWRSYSTAYSQLSPVAVRLDCANCPMDSMKGLNSQTKEATLKRAIVNVDPGLDDLYALLVLLHAETQGLVKIEALLVSHGNTDLKNCLKNTVRLLELVNRTDIPVYKGVESPLIRHKKLLPYFGIDGFGDLNLTHEPDLSVVKQELAATALHRMVSENSGEISLICLGPLTDIAITSKLYSDFLCHVKDVWILGGNYEEISQDGNNTEFNFLNDPEAAHILFDNCPKDMILYTIETFAKSQVSYAWRIEKLRSCSPFSDLLYKAELALKHYENSQYWIVCDAFLAFCFVFPDKCVMRHEQKGIRIELHDLSKRGWIVSDLPKKEGNSTRFIDQLAEDAFEQYMLEIFATDA